MVALPTLDFSCGHNTAVRFQTQTHISDTSMAPKYDTNPETDSGDERTEDDTTDSETDAETPPDGDTTGDDQAGMTTQDGEPVINPATGEQAEPPSGGAQPDDDFIKDLDEAIQDEGWAQSEFRQLVHQGRAYRRPYIFEMGGQQVEILLQPLTSQVYRELQDRVREEMSDEDFNEMLATMKDMDMESMSEEEVMAEVGSLATGQSAAIMEAAKLGIDADSVGAPGRQAVAATVNQMIGGKALDIGVEVIELTRVVEDADEFPGSRSRQ